MTLNKITNKSEDCKKIKNDKNKITGGEDI